MVLNKIKQTVQKFYQQIATEKKSSCCGSCQCQNNKMAEVIARSIGYSQQDINSVPDANLGLGCGNPLALSKIKEGDTVLDLGSGAGFDCFLAAKKVGPTGRVIGVDMTLSMIEKAQQNADKYHYPHVEFRLGDIENLPTENDSIDVVISNCVINLAPDKKRVFQEIKRVLKKGGRAYISDIVLLSELTAAQRNDEDLIGGCVGGALLKDEYLKLISSIGLEIIIQAEDKDISKRQYQGIALESIKIEAIK